MNALKHYLLSLPFTEKKKDLFTTLNFTQTQLFSLIECIQQKKLMEKPVYLITKFSLIGKEIYTFEKQSHLKVLSREDNTFVDSDGDKRKGNDNVHFTLCEGLDSLKGKEAYDASIPYLPYFADVTEDLPNSVLSVRRKLGGKPTTWKNCQLMSEKHGGYLQFFHHETKEVLRIAINSNYYVPVKRATQQTI